MAKMKPGQISAKRTYELADSLKKISYTDHSLSKQFKKEGNNKAASESYRSAINAHQKSDRLKSLADAAMKKANRDYPLSESPNPEFNNQK